MLSPDSIVQITRPRPNAPADGPFLARLVSVDRRPGYSYIGFIPTEGVRGAFGFLRVPDVPGPLSPTVVAV